MDWLKSIQKEVESIVNDPDDKPPNFSPTSTTPRERQPNSGKQMSSSPPKNTTVNTDTESHILIFGIGTKKYCKISRRRIK